MFLSCRFGHVEDTWKTVLSTMDAEAVIAGLDEIFTPDEAAIAERMLREYGGTIPDKQLLSEIGLAVAIHRRRPRGRR